MSQSLREKSKARRAVIILYILMAVGILLPFAILWLKR
jgi:hypothetical protein